MAEIFVERRVEFRTRRHEEAEPALALPEQPGIGAQLSRIIQNVLQDIDADEGVRGLRRGGRFDGPLEQRLPREALAKPRAEFSVGFDGDEALHLGPADEMRGVLPDARAYFEDVAAQRIREFAQDGLPIVAGQPQWFEFEIRRDRRFIGPLARSSRRQQALISWWFRRFNCRVRVHQLDVLESMLKSKNQRLVACREQPKGWTPTALKRVGVQALACP